MIEVRALPRSFDREYAKYNGEGLFCAEFNFTAAADDCSGWPEVEITVLGVFARDGSRKQLYKLLLCREHAGYIAQQLAEAIELADGADILRTKERT